MIKTFYFKRYMKHRHLKRLFFAKMLKFDTILRN